MLDLKASRFYRAALQSGLIDEAGLEACWEQIPPEKRTPDAIDRRLARQAITMGRITLWQAQQLMAGRSTGYRIDKYILLDLLGRGGMGRVYLAKDVRLNRRVALKILSQERMNNPRAIARFQREAKVGAQLQHEHLVRVYDEGDSGGVRYLVMEYIEGKNIGQLIGEQSAIPWPTAARLARQVALGLEHAQLKGLIHRDVNPCNILVTVDGTAKLTDLGLAIDLADQDNVTRDGATVGTFDYVSPEQARHSRSVDTRADVYSLGCTLFHMIAGRVPFPVTSLPEKLYAHQLHDPEPLNELVPGVPEGLADVVRKMMRKRPEERQQSPMEVAQALEPYAIESGWTTTTAPAATVAAVAARPAAAGAPAATAPDPWAAALNLDLGPRTTSAGSRPSGTAPGSSPSGSGPEVAVGDSFFPLDLGPDDPLIDGLKVAPRPRAPIFGRIPQKARVIAGAVAVALIAAVVAILAFFSSSGSGGARQKKGPPVEDGSRSRAIARGDIVVRFRDGASVAVKTLPEAIAMAVRDRAEVILAGGTTFRLENVRPIRVPDGGLTIRAAEGARPTLDIAIKGPESMFLVNANLRLTGLTVVVRYETPTGAPVLQAERDLVLDRCTFRALGPADRSRFALAEGRRLEVTGCLFEGFETALDVAATQGMTIALKQSIFLAPRAGDEASGLAIRVRSMFGQGAACRLSLENGSVRAAAFLEAVDFKAASPLEIQASASAFLVKAAVTFDGEEKDPVGPESVIRWSGRDNRFRVTGGSWVARTGGAKLAGAPADLAAWSRLTRGESGSRSEPLTLAKEPPDPTTPRDCALLAEDGKPVGADPGQVGPR